jgi:hypothetical protein
VRRKRLLQWVILTRKERGKLVVICEPLRRKQISCRLKQGWELVS